MNNRKKQRTGLMTTLLLSTIVIIAAQSIAASLATIVIAQGQPKLEIGVLYSCPQANNYEFKVISCDDKDWCQVFIANKYAPGGGNVTGQGKDSVISLMKRNECSVKGKPTTPQTAEAAPINETAPKDDPPLAAPAKDQANPTGECISDPRLLAKPKAGDSMEVNSKRAILNRFQQAVDKGDKIAVGIVFETFQIGAPRLNRRGDTLYLEDAGVGTKIYPIKSKFNLCSRYSTEITRDATDGRYECFKDNFGEWACATASGYHILNTKYEKATKR